MSEADGAWGGRPMTKAVWQFSAGDGRRDYSDVCLQFGVALAGPGNPGPYPKKAYLDKDSPDYRYFLSAFCEDMPAGDLIALKQPRGREWVVLAIGEVGPYHWREQFADVDGWNLQHTRDVSWRVPPDGSAVPVARLGRGTLKRAPQAAEALSALYREWTPRAPEPIPEVGIPLGDDVLTNELVSHGMAVRQCETLVATINRLRRLGAWYQEQGQSISEHEIRTFLIVPLLQALGWSEQRTKIELAHMDIALFDEPYRADDDPSIIIESKRPYTGLGKTVDQARAYAERHPGCRALAVTDGFRYHLFLRDQDSASGWGEHEAAYANLMKPLARHPYRPDVEGTADLFRRLLAPQAPLL